MAIPALRRSRPVRPSSPGPLRCRHPTGRVPGRTWCSGGSAAWRPPTSCASDASWATCWLPVHRPTSAGASASRGLPVCALPRPELDAMLQEFTDLEVTVGSVLAGRELANGRAGGATDRPCRVARRLGSTRASRRVPGRCGGRAARRARTTRPGRPVERLDGDAPPHAHPGATFELLVHPWVTVVGPLPA